MLVRMISELTRSARLAVGVLLALGEQDVDAVVGQDESAGAGFRRNFGRDRPQAARQDCRHEAGAVGLDQLLLADRFAGDKGRAHDRTGDIPDGFGVAGAVDDVAGGGHRRPGLPLQILRLDDLAEPDVDLGDENFHRRQLRNRFGGTRLVVRSTGEVGSDTTGTERDGQDDNTCDVHTLYALLLRGMPQLHGADSLPLKASLGSNGIRELEG